MLKKLLFLLIISPWVLSCQNSLSGEFSPAEDYDFVILYRLTPTGKVYAADTKVDDKGDFKLNLDSTIPKGNYRLVYNLPEEEHYFDLIHNGKDNIQFTFSEAEGVVFKGGDNKILSEYLAEMNKAQKEIDSKLSSNTVAKQDIESLFVRQSQIQSKAESASKGSYVSAFIKSNKPYIPDSFVNKNIYDANRKSEFFDNFDFENAQLQSSSFPLKKIGSYYHEFVTTQGGANYQSAIDDIYLGFKNADLQFQKYLLATFWQNLKDENKSNAANYLAQRYLITIADTTEDQELSEKLQLFKNLSIGVKAPNFTLTDFDNDKTLYDLEESEFYILAFWSTECSHCLKHIPELHEKMKTLSPEKIRVIAVGLELDEAVWREKTKELPGFIHVLAMGESLDELVKIYDVRATPTFYVLNKDKRMAAKPRGMKNLYIGIDASAKQQ